MDTKNGQKKPLCNKTWYIQYTDFNKLEFSTESVFKRLIKVLNYIECIKNQTNLKLLTF